MALLSFAVWAAGQNTSTTPPRAAPGVSVTPPGQPPPQQPTNTPPTNPSGDASQSSQGQEPETRSGDVYVFKKEVDEVTLHATVVDDHNRLVTNLARTDFTVMEDGKPQKITSFRREDIPVALGIVIDNSGSMRDKRPAVNAAAINLVQSSNPQDKVFVVNFNEEYFLDQDYTASIPKLKDALERIEARGGTALYDAVVASSDHLKKSGELEKKVLLVVTDGNDNNPSGISLEQLVRKAQASGVLIYSIGLLNEEEPADARAAKRALKELAEASGGQDYYPKDLAEVEKITPEVAHEIRNQYLLAYSPTNPALDGTYRQIRVKVNGYERATVRTRSGYYASSDSTHSSGASSFK